MSRCPTDDELERYFAGVGVAERDDLGSHVTSCPACQRWVEEARADEALLPSLCEALAAAPEPEASATSFPLDERLGSYRLLGKLGEGGMGVVYEAEQDNPRRRVALKVIQQGVASAAALRRLEQEAQVLGRLRHPGIAHVYEAGSYETPHGRQPFFAMELMDGRQLLEHADEHRLERRERLQLLIRICEAVQHAHQAGVVHRDLKPGNILVGDDGQPKVLDFGVARISDPDASDAPDATDAAATALHTRPGQVIGTLQYMSPEQVRGDSAAVGACSDVYALGVIGYQLLSGRLPYDVAGRALPDAARVIAEDEPTSLGWLDRSLRGDLDTILHKALEKDVERRYASAADLAADLSRHLRHEPIAARPPSAAYQMRKFARRNKALVLGVAAVFAVLVAGVITTTTQMFLARRQASRAEAVSSFLREVLLQGSPEQVRERDPTIREVLAEAARRIDHTLAGEPEAEAEIRGAIGAAFAGLGAHDEARVHLRRALELSLDLYGDEHPSTAWARVRLGHLALKTGEFDEALHHLRRSFAAFDRLSPDDRTLAGTSLNGLGLALYAKGRFDEAEALIRHAIEAYRSGSGADHPNVGLATANLGLVLEATGDHEEAEQHYRNGLAVLRDTLGNENPHVATVAANLASVLRKRGALDEAEQLARAALAIVREVHGTEHPQFATRLQGLAIVLAHRDRHAEAEPALREALRVLRKTLDPDHARVVMALRDLGSLLGETGRGDEGEPLLRDALDRATRSEALGVAHPITGEVRGALARVLAKLRRFAEAETVLLDAHARTGATAQLLAELYEAWGKRDQAARWRARVGSEPR